MDFPGIAIDLSTVEDQKKPDPQKLYDLMIIGGGPAALTAAVYAARKMIKMALITRDFGGQVKDTSKIENYPGYQTITGQELVHKFIEHVQKFDVPIREDGSITNLTRSNDQFQVIHEDGSIFLSRAVIWATGKRHRLLNVPGEKKLMGRGVAFCAICDAPFFRDKEVVVAGGGNSGFTAALDLLKVAKKVTLINRSKGFNADEILIQAVKKYNHINLLDNHEIVEIHGTSKVESISVVDRSNSKKLQIRADGIFIQIGLDPNTEPIKNIARLTDYGEMKIDCSCRSNIEGLFGAGDVTTVPYDQIIISAGEGAKAALAAYDYLVYKGWI